MASSVIADVARARIMIVAWIGWGAHTCSAYRCSAWIAGKAVRLIVAVSHITCKVDARISCVTLGSENTIVVHARTGNARVGAQTPWRIETLAVVAQILGTIIAVVAWVSIRTDRLIVYVQCAYGDFAWIATITIVLVCASSSVWVASISRAWIVVVARQLGGTVSGGFVADACETDVSRGTQKLHTTLSIVSVAVRSVTRRRADAHRIVGASPGVWVARIRRAQIVIVAVESVLTRTVGIAYVVGARIVVVAFIHHITLASDGIAVGHSTGVGVHAFRRIGAGAVIVAHVQRAWVVVVAAGNAIVVVKIAGDG